MESAKCVMVKEGVGIEFGPPLLLQVFGNFGAAKQPKLAPCRQFMIVVYSDLSDQLVIKWNH